MIKGNRGGLSAVKGVGFACTMTLDPGRRFQAFRHPPADEDLALFAQDRAKVVS